MSYECHGLVVFTEAWCPRGGGSPAVYISFEHGSRQKMEWFYGWFKGQLNCFERERKVQLHPHFNLPLLQTEEGEREI